MGKNEGGRESVAERGQRVSLIQYSTQLSRSQAALVATFLWHQQQDPRATEHAGG